MAGRKQRYSKAYQPPMKNKMKCIDAISRWKYSHRYMSSKAPPLYSVAYPATTSASVSEWSNGVRLDSSIKIMTKPEAAGLYKKKNQYKFWDKTKS